MGVDPTKEKVEDAMSTVVYSVSPDAPLDEVVATMAEHKYGSAVVMQNDRIEHGGEITSRTSPGPPRRMAPRRDTGC